ncbi:MAG: TetR/AcrR family transcriptional regulator [Planctomycetota bacterium]
MNVESPIATRPVGRPRDEARTQAVLKAAAELLAKHPFEDITAGQIAKAAGVSTATLYRWWPSKEAVLMDGYLSSIKPQIGFRKAKTSLSSLRAQLRAVVDTLRGPQGVTLASIVHCAQQSPALREAFLERFLMPRRAEATALIQQAIKDGELRPEIDPEVLMDSLYGAIYYRLLVAHAPLTRRFVDQHMAIVFDATQ